MNGALAAGLGDTLAAGVGRALAAGTAPAAPGCDGVEGWLAAPAVPGSRAAGCGPAGREGSAAVAVGAGDHAASCIFFGLLKPTERPSLRDSAMNRKPAWGWQVVEVATAASVYIRSSDLLRALFLRIMPSSMR